MSAKYRILIVSILLALPLTAAALERIALLPASAQAHVRISNTTNFWNQLQQSSIGKLWVDPQFQDFLGNPDAETWQEFFLEGESEAEDEVFVEQLKMLRGELILAFDSEHGTPYIIAAMTDEDFLRSLDMDAKLHEIAVEPFEIIKTTFQDIEIIQYIEKGGTPQEESSWQAHLKNTLIFGYSREWVERSIVQLQKDEIEEPKGKPTAILNIPLSQLIRENMLAEMKSDQTATGQTPPLYEPEALFEALGLLGIENFSARIELRDTEMIVDNNLRISDLTKGIFTILETEPSQLPTLDFIPEHISSIEVGRFNLLRFWQEIPNVLATAMPSVKPQFDMILAIVQQQTGINFEQDLLANIGTKYISYSEATGDQQVSVVAVELKDESAFKVGLETALAAPAVQPQVAASLEIETFLDHTLYTLKSADPTETMAFGVSDGYLLYGQPDGLRQVIRRQTSETPAQTNFERSPLVKGLRENIPARAFGYSAIDWKTNMDVIVRELSKPGYVSVMQQNWAKSGSALPPPDFRKLPPAEHIASFFNVSYQYAEASGEGIHQQIILKY
jgi:hypothetical protein